MCCPPPGDQTEEDLVTSTACVSAQVDAEELRLAVQVEVIVGCVRGDVVGGDQSEVKLEASVLLVHDVEHLLQTQPVLSCTQTSTRDTHIFGPDLPKL